MCFTWLVHRARSCFSSKRPTKVYVDTDKSTVFTLSRLVLPRNEEALFMRQIAACKASKSLRKPIIVKKYEGNSKVGKRFFHRLMLKRKCKDVQSPDNAQHFADVAGVLIYTKCLEETRNLSNLSGS